MKKLLCLLTMTMVGAVACSANNKNVNLAEPGQSASSAPNQAEPGVEISEIYIDTPIKDVCEIESASAYFPFDSARLKPMTEGGLALLAKCMREGPLADKQITITGRTDPRGKEAYNMKLGKSRADSVAEYLESRGVDPGRMIRTSIGEGQAGMDTPKDQYASLRRVDIKLNEPEARPEGQPAPEPETETQTEEETGTE